MVMEWTLVKDLILPVFSKCSLEEEVWEDNVVEASDQTLAGEVTILKASLVEVVDLTTLDSDIYLSL